MRAVRDLMSLAGRRALVTGAEGRIGFAAAETLVELGARIVLMDRAATVTARADQLNTLRPGSSIPLEAELGDASRVRSAVRTAVDQLGGLDIVVHCAAYVAASHLPGWAVPFEHQSADVWDEVMRVNVTSGFTIVQEARRALAATGRGTVVLFSSIYGVVGPDLRLYDDTSMANPVAYGASKGGVLALTRYLATIMAPSVRVNAISPGGVWRNQPAPFHARYIERTPLRRMATEEDLKGAVAYLASDLSSYVSGHNLLVDGGWTAW